MASDVGEATYSRARAMLAAGDASGAISDLLDGVEDEPNEGRLWALLGVAQWSVGAVVDSIESLETALTLVPLGAEGRLALAMGYEVIQKRDLARDLFVGLAEEERLPYGVLEALARALARTGRPRLALDVCRQAAARRPDAVGPLRGVAFYMAQLDAEPEAILPVLFRAFHLDPEDFDTRLLLARRLRQCGRSAEAAELLSVVAIESSGCPSCLNAMREIFSEAGDEQGVARCVAALVEVARDGVARDGAARDGDRPSDEFAG